MLTWAMRVTGFSNRDQRTRDGQIVMKGRDLDLTTEGPFPDDALTHRILGTRVWVADGDVSAALQSLEFYKARVEALQAYQSQLPEPHRTVVCNILANGEPHPFWI